MKICTGWEDGYFVWLEKLAMTIVERGESIIISTACEEGSSSSLCEHQDYSLSNSSGVKPFLMYT